MRKLLAFLSFFSVAQAETQRFARPAPILTDAELHAAAGEQELTNCLLHRSLQSMQLRTRAIRDNGIANTMGSAISNATSPR